MKNNYRLTYLFLAVCFAALTFFLPARWFYLSDSMNKLIQSYSLLQSGYSSEELYYPAKAIDPDYKYFLFQGVWHAEVEGRHLGQYPVAFSLYLSVFLYLIGAKYLNITGYLCILGIVVLLHKHWNLKPVWLLAVVFATYYIPVALDVSENTLFALIVFAGFSFFMKTGSPPGKTTAFLAGLLTGSAVFIRLEVAVFALSLGVVYLGLLIFRREQAKVWFGSFSLYATGITLAFTVFFLFNQVNYGSYLGPRVFQNTGFDSSVSVRAGRAITLLFTDAMKIGYYLYLPWAIVLAVSLCIPRIRSKLSYSVLWTGMAAVLYTFFAALAAPNDGVSNYGPRYLILAVAPMIIVASELIRLHQAKWLRIGVWSGLILSVIWTFGGILLGKGVQMQTKPVMEHYRSCDADIYLFTSHFLSGMIGERYLESTVLLLHSEEDAGIVPGRLQENQKEFCTSCRLSVVTYSEKFRNKKHPPQLADQVQLSASIAEKIRSTIGEPYEILSSETADCLQYKLD